MVNDYLSRASLKNLEASPISTTNEESCWGWLAGYPGTNNGSMVCLRWCYSIYSAMVCLSHPSVGNLDLQAARSPVAASSRAAAGASTSSTPSTPSTLSAGAAKAATRRAGSAIEAQAVGYRDTTMIGKLIWNIIGILMWILCPLYPLLCPYNVCIVCVICDGFLVSFWMWTHESYHYRCISTETIVPQQWKKSRVTNQ